MLNRKGSNQLKIYNFIKLYINQKEYSPSIKGLSSTASVERDLKILENASLIKKIPWEKHDKYRSLHYQ